MVERAKTTVLTTDDCEVFPNLVCLAFLWGGATDYDTREMCSLHWKCCERMILICRHGPASMGIARLNVPIVSSSLQTGLDECRSGAPAGYGRLH